MTTQTYTKIFTPIVTGFLDSTINQGGSGMGGGCKYFGGFVGLLDLRIQPDNKILVGGLFDSYNDLSNNHIVRLNSDGSLDEYFNTGTGFTNGSGSGPFSLPVSGITMQDDQIIVTGNFTSYNDVSCNNIVRLNSGGSLDLNFNANIGFGFDNTTMCSALQYDKIIVGGVFKKFDDISYNLITRLNVDGTLDVSFNSPEYIIPFTDACIMNIVVQKPSGNILAGIWTNDPSYNGVVLRLNPDGSFDESFIVAAFDGPVTSIIEQSNGNILVGGRFENYYQESTSPVPCSKLACLHPDGTFNYNFQMGSGFVGEINESSVWTLVEQPDKKILVGGFFDSYKGQPSRSLIRIDENGNLDTSFQPPISSPVFSVAQQSDGKILAGGNLFDQAQNVVRFLN